MKTHLLRQHTVQSVFAVLDSALIVGGSLLTGTLMKARGFPDPNQVWHPLALFVRSWGFLLILIPGAWVAATIWLEANPRAEFTGRWTFASGALVFAGLVWLMLVSVLLGSGAGTIIQSVE